MKIEVPLSNLDEVEEEVRKLLPHRTPLIENGKLHGVHWFVALVGEASDIVRRKRELERRRAS